MLKPKSLQNYSDWDSIPETPICIKNTDLEWETAYKFWLEGKNPTSSPLWKKGIIMTFEESP